MKRYVKAAVLRIAERVLGNEYVLRQSTWSGYSRDAIQLAEIIDCLPEHLGETQQFPGRVAPVVEDRVCNWYLPSFETPFFGGIMTILRLADYLNRVLGITNRIVSCGPARKSWIEDNIGRAFPSLKKAEVVVLDSVQAILNIPPSDYSVATLWTTAYVLLAVRNTGYKFYLIQDFEPAFYPAGSTYAQAELTYRFGFLGIANTQTIKATYEENYGGVAVVLKPNIDSSVFFPNGHALPETPKRLFYYARPGIPRNGFELATAGLRRLKEQYRDGVDIVCAGADWDPSDFNLKGVVRNVGLLSYSGTGDLYRSCHLGFVMMMTRHPSYLPFELMACGSLVVTNANEANKWLLRDGNNCLLALPSASCISRTLSYAIDHYEALKAVRETASAEILNAWSDWDASLGVVAKFMLAPPLDRLQPPGKCLTVALQGTTS